MHTDCRICILSIYAIIIAFMIIDFSVSNFRSFREKQTISFLATTDTHLEETYVVQRGKYRLLKAISILGANAAGKSNVLEALYTLSELLLKPAKDKTELINYRKFALESKFKQEPTVMSLNFLVGEQRFYYEVEFGYKSVYRECLKCHPFAALREHTVFERITDPKDRHVKVNWGAKYKGYRNLEALNDNLICNRTVIGTYQITNVSIPCLNDISTWLQTYWLPKVVTPDSDFKKYITARLYKEAINREILTAMLQKADPNIVSLDITQREYPLSAETVRVYQQLYKCNELHGRNRFFPTSRKELEVQIGHQGSERTVYFPLEHESKGTRHYFEMAGLWALAFAQPHFMAVDDLSYQLHPELFRYFIQSFLKNKNDSQLLYTTHYVEFLGDRNSFRDDAVWLADKGEGHETHLYALSHFGSDTLRAVSSRYNAYRSGRLGGVPKLGSDPITKQGM